MNDVRRFSPREARRAMDAGALLVAIYNDYKFPHAYIEGAMSWDGFLRDFGGQPDKAATIIFY